MAKQPFISLFPWSKKFRKKKQEERTAEIMKAAEKFLPDLLKIFRGNDITPMTSAGALGGQMYDFFKNYDGSLGANRLMPFQQNGGFINNVVTFTNDGNGNFIPEGPKEKPAVTPLSVLNELERTPNVIDLQDLDKKISVLKDKSRLANQHFVKEQIDGLTERLENRKKYSGEIQEFFEFFPCTSDEKIDNLLEQYKLVMREDHLFVPTFPDDAIAVMKEYTRITKLVCDKKPVFYVIAEESDFQKKYKKNDPILLVQSPFGFFWQILGAWDKEMLLLHEL